MKFWHSAFGLTQQQPPQQQQKTDKSDKRHCFLIVVTFLILSDLYFVPTYANFRPKLEVVGTRFPPRKVNFGNPTGVQSPIFYLKLASNLRNSINTGNNNNRHWAHTATTSPSSHFPRRNSNLYKLPLQFVSNAKPVDIIHGITRTTLKTPHKTVAKFYKPSKVLYLSTKYVSNAKPIRPIIKHFGKKKKKYGYGLKMHRNPI